jgi:hypothetical protein
VSDHIVPGIRACGALIYLEGGRSEESLWVNFERDYALRSGLRVIAFDPKNGNFREDPGRPVPLRVELLIGEDREDRAGRLLAWLKEERSFKFDRAPTRVKMKEIPLLVAELIQDGRVTLWLLDGHLVGVASLALQIPPEMVAEAYPGVRAAPEFDDYASWLSENSLYARLSPDWHPTSSQDSDIQEFILSEYPIERKFWTGWGVDLVSGQDEAAIDWNRADDLIVRLTLLLQRSQPFFNDQEEETS